MPGIYESCLRPCLAHPIVYYTLQAVRWVPVVFIVAIVCWGYYAYVFELCFMTVTNIFERVIYLFGFHVLLVLFMWSYYQTIFAPIGRPSSKFFLPLELKHDIGHVDNPTESRQILDRFARQNDLPITMRAYDGSVRYCEKCQCVKPDRCHHCSVCGQCVLKFDHHCPWVNTCVNYRNYKFFIQFLGYALAFCLWGFFTDMQYFISFWQGDLSTKQPGRFHILFMFFVTGMFAISVSCLFFYHLYLTAKNQSTIESFRAPVFTYGPDKNGYNLGIRRNYREVFGDNRLLWFLPIFSARGDGYAYVTRTLSAEEEAMRFTARDPADSSFLNLAPNGVHVVPPHQAQGTVMV